MNEKIGFDCCQILLEGCDCCADLDEAYRILNNFYRVIRPRLIILDKINNNNDGGI